MDVHLQFDHARHWRLQCQRGVKAMWKSVKQGDREASPWDLEVGSFAVQLKVVVGTKYTRVGSGPFGLLPRQ